MDFEYQYVAVIERILSKGIKTANRTGIDTLTIQHAYFYLNNININFPVIKGKKVFPKKALIEMMWFMNGLDDISWLEKRGVKYWTPWADEKGMIGKSYGYNFRNFNGLDNYTSVINSLVSNPLGRRHILNLWNASTLNETTLPPCLVNYQLSCIPNPCIVDNECNIYYVDLHVCQRSADVFLGIPYDFMLASWYLMISCHLGNIHSGNFKITFIPRDIHYTCNDTHIYLNTIEQSKQYIGNVEENKNNIIDQKVYASIDLYKAKNMDDYLNHCDKTGYNSFDFNLKKSYPIIKTKPAV